MKKIEEYPIGQKFALSNIRITFTYEGLTGDGKRAWFTISRPRGKINESVKKTNKLIKKGILKPIEE